MNDIVRKLAKIVRIDDILPIENADSICQYVIGGWKVVDSIGKYSVDELVVYCEVDSWIPTEIAPFLSKGKEPREFNGVKGERLRTIKLRGALSQGLLLPITLLANLSNPPENFTYQDYHDLDDGDDVTNILNIQKWEVPENAQLAGQTKGTFPYWGRKTDQERCQNIKKEIQYHYDADTLFEITIKLDGSSFSIGHNSGEIVVCSRNLSLKLDQQGNAFVDAALKNNILERIPQYGNILISSELIGVGIQKNPEKLSYIDYYVFDIFDVDMQKYIGAYDRHRIVEELGLNHVPILNCGVTLRELGLHSTDKILEFAEGKSLKADRREGVVFKSLDGNFSFKAIANSYLLKAN